MGNSFGRLCSGSRFRGNIKENITANDATRVERDNRNYSETREDVGKGNNEDPDKVKEKSKMIVPQLQDGYMKIEDFKKCEMFLTQPYVEIPDATTNLWKPDMVYGYIKDVDEDANYAAMKEQKTQFSLETQNDYKVRPGAKYESVLRESHSLSIQANTREYQQTIESERKKVCIQRYANDAKMFTMFRQGKREGGNIFISLPNLCDIYHKSVNENSIMFSSKTCKTQEPSSWEVVFEDTAQSTDLIEEVIDGVCGREQHQMQELKLINTRRNSEQSEQSESSTDSGQSSFTGCSSETRLKRSNSDRYLCTSNCSKCRAVYMEYMVDVYEQLIVRQVKVTDILDLLTVLDDRSKEVLRSKHIQSPHGAMELLINMLKRSHAPGKWQCLYDAMEASEFTYISMLLKEETENQYDYSTDVLALIKPELKSRMYLPEFLDKVFERQLVTEAEKDQANSLPDLEAKTFVLERVDKHLPEWNHALVEVLKESFMDDLAVLFVLVSQDSEDDAPKPKECDNKSNRRALRNRRRHIMKIAHGNASEEVDSSLKARDL